MRQKVTNVLEKKISPSLSSNSHHSIQSEKLSNTEQIKKAIDQNSKNLIKSLKQYFLKKALEAVRE